MSAIPAREIGLDPGSGGDPDRHAARGPDLRHGRIDDRRVQLLAPSRIARVQVDRARACGDTGDGVADQFLDRYRHRRVLGLRGGAIQRRLQEHVGPPIVTHGSAWGLSRRHSPHVTATTLLSQRLWSRAVLIDHPGLSSIPAVARVQGVSASATIASRLYGEEATSAFSCSIPAGVGVRRGTLVAGRYGVLRVHTPSSVAA